MPECTLCGKSAGTLNKIELEGAIVEVCDECVSFGKLISKASGRHHATQRTGPPTLVPDSSAAFVEDYGERVRKAHEALGLNRADFAKKINERESLIERIEQKRIEPDDALTQKIERSLKIKLRETS